MDRDLRCLEDLELAVSDLAERVIHSIDLVKGVRSVFSYGGALVVTFLLACLGRYLVKTADTSLASLLLELSLGLIRISIPTVLEL